ncbi:MAG: hypothetical protein K0S65_6395 [Labilithrix sp.]|nr:hypothetical protein [Labilithrix sp.]
MAACGLDITGSPADPSNDAGADATPNVGEASTDAPSDVVSVPDAAVDADADPPDLPTLELTTTTPGPELDLDVEGTGGWAHWGLNEDEDAFNRRDGFVDAITNFQLTVASGGTNLRTFKDNRTTIKWANGTPTASTNGTRHGIYSKDNQPTFTVPVKVTPQTTEVIVYAGLFRAKTRLVATLGDEDAAPTKTAEHDHEPGNADFRFAFAVHAVKDSALTIRWTMLSPYDSNNSNVTLVAVTIR